MLVIRPQQSHTFRHSRAEQFARELAARLRSKYPSQTASLGDESALDGFVSRTLDRLTRFGVDTRGGVTVLAELMLQFGEEFERSGLREWTMTILQHPTLPGALKAQVIHERYQELTGGRGVIKY